MSHCLRGSVATASALIVSAAFAWDAPGHMVIAEIAFQHLRPSARAEALQLLKTGATDRAYDFVTAASWADDIRRDRRETGPWHYIDLHFRQDGQADTNKPDAENVVWAIHKFEGVLADKSQPIADRADALRFLIHFVGDIHQPLHATSRDTASEPNGDRGGNDFPIAPTNLPGDDRPVKNLHALWDAGCGLFPWINRPLTPATTATIDRIAATIQRDEPFKRLPQAHNLDPMVWAQESLAVDKAVVYDIQEGAAPSAAYLQKGQRVSERRAALAGYRLAAVLNQILK